jgi:hypothetical protein
MNKELSHEADPSALLLVWYVAEVADEVAQ